MIGFILAFTKIGAQNNIYETYLTISDSLKVLTEQQLKGRAEQLLLKHKQQNDVNFYNNLLEGDIQLKKSDFKPAILCYLKATKQVNGDVAKDYLVNYKIGKVHLLNDNITLAASYYNKALLLKQENNFSSSLDFTLLFENGLINSYLENNKKSIHFYLKALDVAKSNNWKIKEAAMMNNLGLAYLKNGDTVMSRQYLFNCLANRLQIKDTSNYGQIFNNIGTYYLTTGDYQNALIYFKKGLENRQLYKAALAGVIESKVNICKAFLKLNNTKQALNVLNEALQEAKNNHHIELERRALEPLILIYDKQRAFEKAYQIQKRYYFIKDSLYGLEKVQEMKSLSYQYDFNKKLQNDSLKYLEQNMLNKKQIEIQKEKNKTLFVFAFVVVLALLVCSFFITKLNKSNKEKAKAHDLISEQKEELLQKQKEITASIHYAKRIQEALLPNQKYIKKQLDKNP